MSRISELTSKWDDDGASRGSAYVELRDAALAIEQQLEAAKQRELELLAVIDEMSKLVIQVKLCRDEGVTQYPYLDQLYRMAEERRKE